MGSARYTLALATGFAGATLAWGAATGQLLRTLPYTLAMTAALAGAVAFVLQRVARADEDRRRRDLAGLVSERRVFAGLMAASIAHDSNNVLFAVLADLAESEDPRIGTRGGGDEARKRLRHSVERLVGLNRRLLTAGRQGIVSHKDLLDVVAEVREAVETARALPAVQGCVVRFTGEGRALLDAHPILVQQAVTNLVLNAAEAAGADGEVEVRTVRDEEAVLVEVHDDGPGVALDRRAGLFEAFASTKHAGSGLGLFSVKACARALGGTVEVGDSPLGGARFRLRLPLHRPRLVEKRAEVDERAA